MIWGVCPTPLRRTVDERCNKAWHMRETLMENCPPEPYSRPEMIHVDPFPPDILDDRGLKHG